MSDTNPLDHIAARIVERYRNPSRKAYMYLFRLSADALPSAVVPEAAHLLAAWVDEGRGLLATDPSEALRLCTLAQQIKPHTDSPQALTPHQRRQMMARIIQFSVRPVAADEIAVHLVSRALGFTPRGDREVVEDWRQTPDGVWYSAYRERERAE